MISYLSIILAPLSCLRYLQGQSLQAGMLLSSINYIARTASKKNLHNYIIFFLGCRHQIEGGYSPQFNSSGQGLMPMAEMNNSNSQWKQVLS